MKTVLIDCRFAALHAGLGRYARELVVSLLARSSAVTYILVVRNAEEKWIPAGATTIVADIPHYSLKEQTVLPEIIRSSGANLLFVPHFNVPLFCPIPFVATVHDLILHRYPNNASVIKQMMYRLIIGHSVRKAQKIVAVSSFTSQELADVYGSTAAEKAQVILEGVSDLYHPVAESVSRDVLKKYDVTRPYFLYVGNAKQHKNVQMLLDAFQKSGVSDTDLLLVSGGPEVASLTLPPNTRILSSISDADLPALYSAARCFVTASLYEGYCLPVAEALACGCPVIASNRTAIPETATGHATLVEPTVEALSAAMKHPPAKQKPVIVGTWETAAEATEKLLVEALQSIDNFKTDQVPDNS